VSLIFSLFFFFFFSSRRRHTRSASDWSSDVCSSDLGETANDLLERALAFRTLPAVCEYRAQLAALFAEWWDEGSISQETRRSVRSEERRVGKECRCGRGACDEQKKKKDGSRRRREKW